jgi:CRP-like cAMP-binding protein
MTDPLRAAWGPTTQEHRRANGAATVHLEAPSTSTLRIGAYARGMVRIPDPSSTGNFLLDALPPGDRASMLERARTVRLAPEQVLVEAGDRIHDVVFPVTAVVSLLTTLRDGAAVETATIGREGMLGVALFLHDDRAPNSRAVAQLAGTGIAVAADDFRAALTGSAKLEGLMFSYTRALLVQVAQSVACAATHPVRERLARWLLQTTDRVGSETVQLTHQFVSDILGVRRASVTDVLQSLRRTGAVDTRRGAILIADRARLAAAACECYGVLHDEYERIYGAPRDRAGV